MRLPDFLEHLFVHYNFSSMDTKIHRKTIIITVLSYGDWEEIEWLFGHYGHHSIEEIFLEDYDGNRTLPEPTRRLWELLFVPLDKRKREESELERWRGYRLLTHRLESL